MDDRIRQRRAHGELERRLEAYAGARLSPDPRQMARIRTALVAEASGTLAGPSLLAMRVPSGLSLVASTATLSPSGPHAASGGPRVFTGWRRASVALAAASLAGLLLGGSAFAASRAGAPLYGVRVWLEAATLPADQDARAAAELVRLQSRLGDVADAAARADGSAVSAALAEYRASVEEALAAAGENHDILARLQIELERHRVVLASLLGLVPSNAQDAIQQVLDRDQHALDVIHDRGQPGSNGNGTPVTPPGKPASGGGPVEKPAGQPTPPAQPTPPSHVEPTPRPERTPRGGQDSHGANRGN
jgi:hypothetical protein